MLKKSHLVVSFCLLVMTHARGMQRCVQMAAGITAAWRSLVKPAELEIKAFSPWLSSAYDFNQLFSNPKAVKQSFAHTLLGGCHRSNYDAKTVGTVLLFYLRNGIDPLKRSQAYFGGTMQTP